MLVTGTSMSMYPIWPLSVASSIKKGIIERWYPIAIFYMLILFSCFFVLVSKFATIQVLLFSMNLVVAAILLGWRFATPLVIVGFYFGAQLYQHYFKLDYGIGQFMSAEFLLIYMILSLGSMIFVFLKPKQEYIHNTQMKVGSLECEVTDLNEKIVHYDEKMVNYDEKIVHYSEKIAEKDQEITRLGHTAQKILNNVNHELRLPIGNVVNFSEMLHDGLGKFNEEQLKTLSDEVYQNSTRLSSMILNMLDLATLDVQKVGLNKRKVNFSEIIIDRVKSCSKIYLDEKPIEFRLSIEPDMEISIDPDYMRQVIDNLVINAIKFSKEGDIEIKAQKQNKLIIFTITDQGIGIPKEEIYDIFTPFKMGSNAESKAEGRGVGLALCKSVIKAHDGEIRVESKGIGARFRFVLPSL